MLQNSKWLKKTKRLNVMDPMNQPHCHGTPSNYMHQQEGPITNIITSAFIYTLNIKYYVIYRFSACALSQWNFPVTKMCCRCVIKVRTTTQTRSIGSQGFCMCLACIWKATRVRIHLSIQMWKKHSLPSFMFSGWQAVKKSSLQSSSSLPRSSSRYHIGQGLLIAPRLAVGNGERKGIMTVRREKRGSERKEGQTGYYEREGWELWRHLESLFTILSHGLRSQSDWSIRPAL